MELCDAQTLIAVDVRVVANDFAPYKTPGTSLPLFTLLKLTDSDAST
ncbi:MAG: hypothetical protein ACXVIS_10570 [Halobacteriota archaeon]